MIRLFALASLFTSTLAFAGGSITREDATAKIQEKDAALASVFSLLPVDAVGSAVRLRDGSRQLPLDFDGQMPEGGAIHVNVDINSDGKVVLTVVSVRP